MDEPTITLEESYRLIEEAKKDYERYPLEEGKRFKLITQHHIPYKLAQILGISRSYIRQHLEIYDNLIPEAKELLKEGKIGFTQALSLSRAETEEIQRSLVAIIEKEEKIRQEREKRQEEEKQRRERKYKYAPILNAFIDGDETLVEIKCENIEANYLRRQIKKRIDARELENKIKTYVINNKPYLEKT